MAVFEQTHGEVGLALGIETVIQYTDDVGMAKRGQRFKFLGERKSQISAVARVRGKQQIAFAAENALKCYWLPRQAINGAIDDAHPALPDHVLDKIAPTNELRVFDHKPSLMVCSKSSSSLPHKRLAGA